MKHWNLSIFGYWVIGAGCSIKKDLESSPSLPNCSKDHWKLLSMLISINWPSLVTSWFVVQKIFKNAPCFMVTDLVNHGMAKTSKTWISWEWNIIFLRNKKIVNLCFRWHILRSYRFVMEVTFKVVSFTVVAKYFWASRIKGECAEDILWPKLACTAITSNMHRIYNLI